MRIKTTCTFFIILLVCISLLTSCGSDPIPKPKAYLSLEYPEAKYDTQKLPLPFTFDKNELATSASIKNLRGSENSYAINIEYPRLKGTIYLTYKPVANRDDLINYLRDTQSLTQEHTKKADGIDEFEYENKEEKVYGIFYEVGGNAASQSQFYVTDSTNHFLTGSLYFYAKPNYDSLLPAAHYLQNDVRRLMESVRWKK